MTSEELVEDAEDKMLLKLMQSEKDGKKMPIKNLYKEMGWE